MSQPLPTLEKDRSEVLRQISHLGDLRPGSIVEVRDAVVSPTVIAPSRATPVMDPTSASRAR
jgi:hypothetical protein